MWQVLAPPGKFEFTFLTALRISMEGMVMGLKSNHIKEIMILKEN